jgi:capsular polysaccharide export protein
MNSLSSCQRHFLLLQGPRSPFFARLGAALVDAGQTVTKVHFNPGDHLYHWLGLFGNHRNIPTQSCKASAQELPAFYTDLLKRTGATDIVLFGDCRPVHRPAIEIAKILGMRVHVFEEGYFRPDWVTLERDGVNGYSSLPEYTDWYLSVAEELQISKDKACSQFTQPRLTVGASMVPRVCHDVLYNTGNLLNSLLYPNYTTHVPHSILSEYAAYVARFVRIHLPGQQNHRVNQRSVNEIIEGSKSGKAHYFVVPLQIPGDSQLSIHSDFADTHEFIGTVMRSFVAHAPNHCLLVLKNHPLDPGLKRHDRFVADLARELDCGSRLRFLETGHLPSLLDHAAGVVAVNSTTIGQSLFHRCPTIALGKSMFALPGLTFEGTLDDFWDGRREPDMGLFRAFHRVVIHATQVNGGLYSQRGIDLCVANSLPRLLAKEGKLEALLKEFPPRHMAPVSSGAPMHFVSESAPPISGRPH